MVAVAVVASAWATLGRDPGAAAVPTSTTAAATTLAVATTTTVPVEEVPRAGMPTLPPDPAWAAAAGEQLRARAALDAFRATLPASSCLVVASAGQALVDVRGDEALIPASTEKLITAAAAIDLLGAGARLRTSVRAAAGPDRGVVAGDLWLVGAGDPLLATADYAALYPRPPEPRTSLETLADRVVAAGVEEVTGAVVGDESALDTVRVVPSWPARYVRDNEAGPLSALTVNDGFSSFTPAPVRAEDPARAAASTFTDLLKARGVRVGAQARSGAAPAGAVEVAGVDSGTIAEVAGEALRESDNGTAELLLKLVGRAGAAEGSTAAGAAVAAGHLGALGIPTAGITVVDGSGLDRGNRVTCRALVTLLDRAADPVVDGLSVAGRTGTLTRRYAGTPYEGRVRAKSGSLTGVLTLAGFADGPAGQRYTFALLVNRPGADSRDHPFWNALFDALLGLAGPPGP